MASLPTAYAGQRFGRKSLDYYAVEGEVVGTDPRARSDERRLQDFDGARHTIRLMDSSFRLEPGDTATVLRMQAGPAQRSRPVAVVNHDSGGWTRTHPGAPGLLARAGVSRAANWALTMGLFAVAALVLVWPFLRDFLVEVDPATFSAAPGFNAAELAAGLAPMLAGWSFAEVSAPLTAQISSFAPGLEAAAQPLVFGGGVLVATLGVYFLRSWRLLWAPLFVLALGLAAIGYGGVAGVTEPALSGLAVAAAVFLLGGITNRIRDAARLESRIAVLADHLLRQGPQDTVAEARDSETVEDEAAAEDEDADNGPETLSPAVAASAASLREPGGEDEAPEADEASQTAQAAESESDATPDDAAQKEAASEGATPEESGPEDAAAEDMAADAETADAQDEDAPDADAEAADASAENPVEAASADPGPSDGGAEEDGDASAEAAPDAEPVEETEAQAETAEPADAAAPVADRESDAADAEDAGEDAKAEADANAGGAAQDASDPPSADAAVSTAPEAEAAPKPEADGAGDAIEGSGEAEGQKSDLDAAAPAGLDPEEAERLRSDPRYASRAIVLPPPPPMPEPASAPAPAEPAAPTATAQTLKPAAPLPDNVVPIFAAAAPEAAASEPGDPDEPDGADRA